jgi:hypothetical protein
MQSGKITLSFSLAAAFLIIGLFTASPASPASAISGNYEKTMSCIEQNCGYLAATYQTSEFNRCVTTCLDTYMKNGGACRTCIGNCAINPAPFDCMSQCDLVCY